MKNSYLLILIGLLLFRISIFPSFGKLLNSVEIKDGFVCDTIINPNEQNVIGLASFSYPPPVDSKILMRNLSPTTPDITSLGRYVMQPPDFSSGLPQITIPLFEITDQDISYPISLFYNYSGFRLNESSTSLGLGWGINQGVIIRLVKHLPDENAVLKKFEEWNNNLVEEWDTGYIGEDFVNWTRRDDLYNLTFNRLFYKLYDAQPDLYIYNFGGYSGKFLWINSEVVKLDHNDILIERTSSWNGNFILTTPDGIKYTFIPSETLYSWPSSISPTVCPSEIPFNVNSGGGYTSAWLLSEIKSNKTKAKIEFEYGNFTSRPSNPELTTTLSFISPKNFGTYSIADYNKEENVYIPPSECRFIKNINSSTSKIKFTNKSRLDGGELVDSIKIYSIQDVAHPAKIIKFSSV